MKDVQYEHFLSLKISTDINNKNDEVFREILWCVEVRGMIMFSVLSLILFTGGSVSHNVLVMYHVMY